MKNSLLMEALIVFGMSCMAQKVPDDAAMLAISGLIQQIQDASETQNGLYYASAFAPEGTWCGPGGEYSDHENLQQAANQMFGQYGPLLMKEWEVRPLTWDLLLVDIY